METDEQIQNIAGDAQWKFHALADAVGEAVVVLDPRGRIRDWNRGAEEMFGHPPGVAGGLDFAALVAAGNADDDGLRGSLAPPACTAQHSVDLAVRGRDGHSFPVRMTVIPAATAEGGLLLVLRRHAGPFAPQPEQSRLDELSRRQMEMEEVFSQRQQRDERLIWQLMHYDPVTGLPNRQGLKDRLLQAMAQADRRGGQVALLMLGIDHFKHFIDTLGHAIGDFLLTATGGRLTECVGSLDNVARLGGDEFAVILPELEHAGAAGEMAQRLLAAAGQPIPVAGHELVLHTSIGIALCPEHGSDPDSLLRNANAALSLAKTAAHGKYRYYAPDFNVRALQRLALEEDLRRALEGGKLEVHYQPLIDLRTGQIGCAEALARWRHPIHGQVSPAQFIPLAEESGLIAPLGEWVLETACAQLKAWQTAGAPDMRMAVNLSAFQFRNEELASTISAILARHDIAPHSLELEITESMLMQDAQQGIAMMHELKRQGIQLAIDDFGTGYSSLNYLKHFPIDTLKIDQCFVRHIPGDSSDAAIVRAIIALAQCLGLKVVAEGVETDQQLRFMYNHRCDMVQGYLFSPPVDARAFAALLAEDRLLPRDEDGCFY